MAAADEWWRVARLLGPWGRAGEWRVAADGGDELLRAGREIFVKDAAGALQPARLAAATRRGGKFMVRLEPESLAVRDAGLYLPAARIPAGDGATPWRHDLIGAELRDGARGAVGTILELVDGPAHPWLKVATRHGEKLVPYVEGYAPAFDAKTGTLTMELPPGLLED